MAERKADFLDAVGKKALRLFARNAAGHRISARRFFNLPEPETGDNFVREGYTLMTTAKKPPAPRGLFK